jgi:hypothetical protein
MGLDFASANLRLTNPNPVGLTPAILSAILVEDGNWVLFRMFIDGTGLDVPPDYTDADGIRHEFDWVNYDINDFGDVTAQFTAHTKQRKKEISTRYAGLWPLGSSEFIPLATDDLLAQDWYSAHLNNDGDFLLIGFDGRTSSDTYFLLHGEWGPAHGPVKLKDMIASDDQNRDLFGDAHFIIDRNESGWPIIMGKTQQELLILVPEANPAP